MSINQTALMSAHGYGYGNGNAASNIKVAQNLFNGLSGSTFHCYVLLSEIADDFIEEFQQKKIPLERAHELMKDHQTMKWVVNRATDVVGSNGSMANNPLS